MQIAAPYSFRMAARRLLGHPWRAAFVVIGIALGTSLWMAGLLSSDSSLTSFAKMVGFDDNRFPVIVRGNGAALVPETLREILPHLSEEFDLVVQQYGEAVIESDRGAVPQRRIRIAGVAGVTATGQIGNEGQGDLSPALWIAPETLRQFSLIDGELVTLRNGDQSLVARVTVQSKLLGGDTAVLPLHALQDLSIAAPSVILVRPRAGDEHVVDRLNRLFRGYSLPWVAESRADRIDRGKDLLAAFRTNIFMMFGLTVAIGVLVIWNALTISLHSAERDFALLRAIGARSGEIVILVLSESVILSILGSILGITAGTPLTALVADAMTGSVQGIYGSGSGAETIGWLSGWDYRIQAVLLAIAASVLAGGCVAIRACAVAPAFGIRRVIVSQRGGSIVLRIILVVSAAVFSACFFLNSAGSAYVASFAIAIGVPAAAVTAAEFFARFAKGIALPLPPTWNFAIRNVCSIRFGHRVSIALITVSTVFIVAFGRLMASFETTLNGWMASRLQADIFIGAAIDHPLPGSFDMGSETVQSIAAVSGVEGISRVDQSDILIDGVMYQINAVDLDVNLRRGVYNFAGPIAQESASRIFVSETAEKTLNRKVGDRVTIGGREFVLAGVVREMSTDRPAIIVDRIESPNPLAGSRSVSVYLAPNADTAEAISRLRVIAEGVGAAVYDQRELKQYIRDLFDQTFLVTRAVRWLVVLFAVTAAVGAIWQVMFERAREVFVSFALGGTRSEFSRGVVAETIITLLWSLPFGMVGGTLLGLIMVEWVNPRSFGWRLDSDYGWWENGFLLGVMVVGLLVATWCFGAGYRVLVAIGGRDDD